MASSPTQLTLASSCPVPAPFCWTGVPPTVWRDVTVMCSQASGQTASGSHSSLCCWRALTCLCFQGVNLRLLGVLVRHERPLYTVVLRNNGCWTYMITLNPQPPGSIEARPVGPRLGVLREEKQQNGVVGVRRVEGRGEGEEGSRVVARELCLPLALGRSRQRCLPPATTA